MYGVGEAPDTGAERWVLWLSEDNPLFLGSAPELDSATQLLPNCFCPVSISLPRSGPDDALVSEI